MHSLALIFGMDAAADIAWRSMISDNVDTLELEVPTDIVDMLHRKNANSKPAP